MTRTTLIAASTLVAAGLGAGAWFALAPAGGDLAACRAEGGGVSGAEIGGPFELVDETGAARSSAELIDRPTLIYFGYTFCPDFCPMDAAVMADAAALARERHGLDLRTLFVTIDPARDTPERLAAFTDAFGDDMIGLTGSEAQIAEAARAYRVYYAKAGDDPEHYLMDHSTFTYLMAPDVGLLDFFRHGADPETVADRAACYAEALG